MTDESIPHKTCLACGQSLPRTDFYKKSAKDDSRASKCKPCQRASMRTPEQRAKSNEYQRRTRDKGRVRAQRWRDTHRDQVNAASRVRQHRGDYAAWAKEYEQTENRREQRRRYREKNAEKLRAKGRAYAASEDGKAKQRTAYFKRKYGITADEYDRLLQSQEGGCAICGENPHKYGLAVDHDHVTGRVRGLLCVSHNTALGFFKDNVALLEKAIQYLLDHQEREKAA
jgi:hypothetical protein